MDGNSKVAEREKHYAEIPCGIMSGGHSLLWVTFSVMPGHTTALFVRSHPFKLKKMIVF